MVKTTKKGNVRKGAKMAGSRLAYDDTKQEMQKGKRKLKKAVKGKKTGGWIAHVKAYAKKHGVSYKVAMTKAKATYKKK